MRKEFTVESGMFIAGGGAAAEYSIWNDTDIWNSAYSVSADSRLSVLKEVWILEHSFGSDNPTMFPACCEAWGGVLSRS